MPQPGSFSFNISTQTQTYSIYLRKEKANMQSEQHSNQILFDYLIPKAFRSKLNNMLRCPINAVI